MSWTSAQAPGIVDLRVFGEESMHMWEPTAERIERAELTRFAAWVQEHRSVKVTESYDQLWSGRSTTSRTSGRRSGSTSTCGRRRLRARARRRARCRAREWFPGARLNYAEHVFRGKPDDAVAIRARLRAARARRVDVGRAARRDRRAIAAGLRRARASAAATASSPTCRTSPRRRGVPGLRVDRRDLVVLRRRTSARARVVDRFAQIEPKVLLAVDGYRYGGKDFDRRDVVAACAREMPSLEHRRAARLPRRAARWTACPGTS